MISTLMLLTDKCERQMWKTKHINKYAAGTTTGTMRELQGAMKQHNDEHNQTWLESRKSLADQVRLSEEVTSGLNESWRYMGKEKKM